VEKEENTNEGGPVAMNRSRGKGVAPTTKKKKTKQTTHNTHLQGVLNSSIRIDLSVGMFSIEKGKERPGEKTGHQHRREKKRSRLTGDAVHERTVRNEDKD